MERQRALIARLLHHGHETSRAKALLEQFVLTLDAHISDLERLQRELATHDAQAAKGIR